MKKPAVRSRWGSVCSDSPTGSKSGRDCQEGGDQTLVLIRRDRARRVDKQSSRTKGQGAGIEDLPLPAGQGLDRALLHPPAQIRARLQGPQAAAGGVHEHAVEGSLPRAARRRRRPRPGCWRRASARPCGRARRRGGGRARPPRPRPGPASAPPDGSSCRRAPRTGRAPARPAAGRACARRAWPRATARSPPPAPTSGEECRSKGASSTSASGRRGSPWLATPSRPATAPASPTSVFARSATSTGSLSAAISARACSAPSVRHHSRAIHSGWECFSAACSGVSLGQRPDQRRRPLARGPPQDRVDEPVPGASLVLGQLDGLGDGRVVGGALQVQQLVQAQAQGVDDRRVEPAHVAFGQLADHVVERRAALDRAVGQAHRQRPFAPVQLLRRRAQRLVGVGAVLEHAHQHRVGAAPCG